MSKYGSHLATLSVILGILVLPSCSGGSGGGGKKKRGDLAVIAFSHVVTGGDVTYDVEIINLGDKAIDDPNRSIRVDFYFHLALAPVPLLPSDSTRLILSLDPGESRQLQFSTFGQTVGTYSSWVAVDIDDYFKESDEDNNIGGPLSVVIEPPKSVDLAITSLTANVTDLDVEYSIRVENLGDLSSGPFAVDLYYDEATAPVPQQQGNDFLTLSGLAAGSSLTLFRTRTGTGPGVYDSWAQVDTFEKVTESDELNNVTGPIPVTVTAPNTPEITVTSFSTRTSGQDVAYRVVLENVGTVDTGAFFLDLYYNRPSAPGIGDAGDQTQAVTNLAAGTSTRMDFFLVGGATGKYASWVLADSAGQVAETLESNNVGGPASIQLGPELEMVFFRIDLLGLDAQYTALVENFGSAATAAFQTDLYYSRFTPPGIGQFGNDSHSFGGLNPEEQASHLFIEPNATGAHEVWSQVDPAGVILEADESNNVVGSYHFNPSNTIAADLEVVAVTPSLSGPEVTFDVEIRNRGGTTTVAFFVDLYLDRRVFPKPLDFSSTDNINVPSLSSGESTHVQLTATAGVGAYRSWIQVDTDGNVSESNEANNVLGPIPIVSGPDPAIILFRIDLAGADAQYTVVTENFGSVITPDFPVDLHYDRVTAPGAGDVGDDTFTFTGMDPRQQATHVFTEVGATGPRLSWAQLDPAGLIAEADEENNLVGGYFFDPGDAVMADLEVTSVAPTVNGSDITYDVTITNLGGTAATSFFVDVYLDRDRFPTPVDLASSDSAMVVNLDPLMNTVVPLTVTAPSGTYRSWVQVDTDESLSESNEGNNVLGPFTVTIP